MYVTCPSLKNRKTNVLLRFGLAILNFLQYCRLAQKATLLWRGGAMLFSLVGVRRPLLSENMYCWNFPSCFYIVDWNTTQLGLRKKTKRFLLINFNMTNKYLIFNFIMEYKKRESYGKFRENKHYSDRDWGKFTHHYIILSLRVFFNCHYKIPKTTKYSFPWAL